MTSKQRSVLVLAAAATLGVGVAMAASSARTVFPLTSDKNAVLDGITNWIPASYPYAAIGRGLGEVQAALGTAREGSTRVVVIFSSGQGFADKPAPVATQLRSAGVGIFVFLVGDKTNAAAFNGVVASSSDVVPIASGTSSFMSFVTKRLPAGGKLDLFYLVDESLPTSNQAQTRSTMKDIAQSFDISTNGAWVSFFASGSTTPPPKPLKPTPKPFPKVTLPRE